MTLRVYSIRILLPLWEQNIIHRLKLLLFQRMDIFNNGINFSQLKYEQINSKGFYVTEILITLWIYFDS